MSNHHPAVKSILRFFVFGHLPEPLQEVAGPFADLAEQVADRCPSDPETTVALRKLLEAKDAAIRAVVASRFDSRPTDDGEESSS